MLSLACDRVSTSTSSGYSPTRSKSMVKRYFKIVLSLNELKSNALHQSRHPTWNSQSWRQTQRTACLTSHDWPDIRLLKANDAILDMSVVLKHEELLLIICLITSRRCAANQWADRLAYSSTYRRSLRCIVAELEGLLVLTPRFLKSGPLTFASRLYVRGISTPNRGQICDHLFEIQTTLVKQRCILGIRSDRQSHQSNMRSQVDRPPPREAG